MALHTGPGLRETACTCRKRPMPTGKLSVSSPISMTAADSMMVLIPDMVRGQPSMLGRSADRCPKSMMVASSCSSKPARATPVGETRQKQPSASAGIPTDLICPASESDPGSSFSIARRHDRWFKKGISHPLKHSHHGASRTACKGLINRPQTARIMTLARLRRTPPRRRS